MFSRIADAGPGYFGLCSNTASLITTPLDTYRTRLQTRRTVEELQQNGKLVNDDLNIDIQNFIQPKLFGYDNFFALYGGTGYCFRMLSFFPMYVVIGIVAESVLSRPTFPDLKSAIAGSISLANLTMLRLKWIQNAIGLKEQCTLNRSFMQEFALSASRYVLMTSLVWKSLEVMSESVVFRPDNFAYAISQIGAVFVVTRFVGYPIETVIRRQMLTNEGLLTSSIALVKNHGLMCLWDGFFVDLMADIIQYTCVVGQFLYFDL